MYLQSVIASLFIVFFVTRSGWWVYLDEVEADGVISLHGDRPYVLWDDLQTLQSSAVTSRQHLRTETKHSRSDELKH